MPIPDSNFVASVPLQYRFVDKDTGEALASGIVTFYSDPDFSVKKSVYQLTLNPDNTITFDALPNPMILSGIGTFVDDTGNNVVPYYFPYDGSPGAVDPGNLELYFVKVESSDSVLQFTLQEWPPNSLSGSGSAGSDSVETLNIISNPQFTVVLFNEDPIANTTTLSVSGTDNEITIAPGWFVRTSGTGTVVLSQLSISENIPSEAATALQIQTTGSITEVALVQRITNSPRLLSNPDTIEETSYISGYVVARSAQDTSANISMTYEPSGGTVTAVFAGSTDSDHEFQSISGSAALETPLSIQGSTGYVDVVISISPLTAVDITSAQVTAVANEQTTPQFIQLSPQQQTNGMMWYYEPLLAYKPIANYALGWDFSTNPQQELGASGGPYTLGGVNRAKYIADQTVLFQSVDSTLSFSFSVPDGLSIIDATTASSFALIQYLDARTAIELLNQRNAVMVRARMSTGTLTGQVHLLWTANSGPAVPVLPASCLTAVDATTGAPTLTSGWNEVSRSGLSTAYFPMTTTQTSFSFSEWDATTTASINTATAFAVVLTFPALPIASQMKIQFCTLCAGDIATVPSPLNAAQTLQGLQYYYQKSFAQGVTPAQNIGVGNGEAYFIQNVGTLTASTGIPVRLNAIMRATPSVALYNPAAANAEIRNIANSNDYTSSSATNINNNSFTASGTSPNPSAMGNTIAVNWTADARFGIV